MDNSPPLSPRSRRASTLADIEYNNQERIIKKDASIKLYSSYFSAFLFTLLSLLLSFKVILFDSYWVIIIANVSIISLTIGNKSSDISKFMISVKHLNKNNNNMLLNKMNNMNEKMDDYYIHNTTPRDNEPFNLNKYKMCNNDNNEYEVDSQDENIIYLKVKYNKLTNTIVYDDDENIHDTNNISIDNIKHHDSLEPVLLDILI